MAAGQQMMLGGGRGFGVYTPIAGTCTGDNTNLSNATGRLVVRSDGTYTGSGLTVTAAGFSGNWITPIPPGGAHWIRATILSGTINAGTTGSWVSLASNQTWDKGPATTGAASAQLQMEIALDSGGAAIVSSGVVTIGYQHTI